MNDELTQEKFIKEFDRTHDLINRLNKVNVRLHEISESESFNSHDLIKLYIFNIRFENALKDLES